MSFVTVFDSRRTMHTMNMFITVLALFTSSCCHAILRTQSRNRENTLLVYVVIGIGKSQVIYRLSNFNLRAMTYPGYEQFSTDLSTLLTTYSPPFIYIHDPESFKSTCAVVHSILQDISASPSSFIIHSTRIDAVSTFTNRLLFEALINSLAGWKVNWQDGCSNWLSNLDQDEEGEKKELRWNENMDTFIHGLRAVHEYLCRQDKGKEHHSTRRLVIVIERAERLKETNPELVVPLTRLAEIVRKKKRSNIFYKKTQWLYRQG